MKAKLILTAFLVSVILSAAGYSHAITLDPSSGPYMTNNDHTAPAGNQSIFYWDQTPYSFIQFAISDLNRKLDLGWTWKYGDTVIWDSSETILKTDMGGTYYNSFITPTNWNSLKTGRAGDWSVYMEWSTFNKVSGNETINFTLSELPTPVPEPMSSALFIIGVAGLAARQIRNKKKSA